MQVNDVLLFENSCNSYFKGSGNNRFCKRPINTLKCQTMEHQRFAYTREKIELVQAQISIKGDISKQFTRISKTATEKEKKRNKQRKESRGKKNVSCSCWRFAMASASVKLVSRINANFFFFFVFNRSISLSWMQLMHE